MGDYYTADPSRLNGQPKATIGDYVEQNDEEVPRRFATLEEARASRENGRARSELEQDYDGISGFLSSPKLSDLLDVNNEDELKKAVLEKSRLVKVYCSLLGLDESQFQESLSFSFWENIGTYDSNLEESLGTQRYWEEFGGWNICVVADSAIKGRYHIMTSNVNRFRNYTVLDNGETTQFPYQLPTFLHRNLVNLIETYERIRNLDHFDPNHCPIMEFIYAGGKNYFLQYHRTRDFQPASFSFSNRVPENGEVEALFVRGASQPGGTQCKTTLIYSDANIFEEEKRRLPESEEGSFGYMDGQIFSEIMSRRRMLQLISSGSKLLSDGEYDPTISPDSMLIGLVTEHLSRSIFFKPKISLIFKWDQLISKEELHVRERIAKETGENQYIDLLVETDGRRAFVKRI